MLPYTLVEATTDIRPSAAAGAVLPVPHPASTIVTRVAASAFRIDMATVSVLKGTENRCH
jgi:hypothetical protein